MPAAYEPLYREDDDVNAAAVRSGWIHAGSTRSLGGTSEEDSGSTGRRENEEKKEEVEEEAGGGGDEGG
ncbi:hypothetical protein ALC53_11345 [Atta colombica]|uniref:Uncharacterized protein n=1 Tax=Atta colombica TaxID=520822 RepID=A0A195B1I8_9HYME|nr:hypothetical protein ALC53_11345 [Atta colombica]